MKSPALGGAFAFLEHRKLTVSTIDSVETYTSGGPVFPIPYRFLENSDIEAVLVRQDGTVEFLTSAQYVVTGEGGQIGGTLTSAYAAGVLATPGATLTISRVMSPVQPTDLRNQGRYLAETQETALDRLTMLIQQGSAGLDRALTRPDGKSYYDAQNRMISNLADPVADQDAATKGWAGRFFGDLIDGAIGPINTTTGILYDAGTLFDYLRFGVNRTVDSISALRLLSSARNQRAWVLGYYAKADGGGGAYYVDTTDTTSADNGGNIIVANDGARWKLATTEPLLIRQFGGKGDGVADDTASAKAWIAACAGRSGRWNSGRWLIQDALDIPANTTLRGAGMSATTVVHGANVPVTRSLLNMASAGGSLVSDLSVDGNSSQTSGFLGSEIDLSGTSKLNVAERVRVFNNSFIGITNTALGAVRDSTLDGPNSATTGGTFGVWCDAVVARTEVRDCHISNWRLNGVFQGGHCLIEGNTFDNNHIQVFPVGGGQIASGIRLRSSLVTGNIFHESLGAGSSGIELDNAETTVVGNVFHRMGGNCIVLQSAGGHVVSDNQIIGAGLAGVLVNPGISGFVISDNRIIGCVTGIDISDGASDYYTVTGNTLLGNTTAMKDGGTGLEKVVHGNAGYQFAKAVTVTASPFTYTNRTGSPATMLVFGGTVAGITLSGRPVASATGVQIAVPRKADVVITYAAGDPPQVEVYAN